MGTNSATMAQQANQDLKDKIYGESKRAQGFIGYYQMLDYYADSETVPMPLYAVDRTVLAQQTRVQGQPCMVETLTAPFVTDLQQAEVFWLPEGADASAMQTALTGEEKENASAAQKYDPWVLLFRPETLKKSEVSSDAPINWRDMLQKVYDKQAACQVSVGQLAQVTKVWELIPLAEAEKADDAWRVLCAKKGWEIFETEARALVRPEPDEARKADETFLTAKISAFELFNLVP